MMKFLFVRLLLPSVICFALISGCKKKEETEADSPKKEETNTSVKENKAGTKDTAAQPQAQNGEERRYHLDMIEPDSASDYVIFPVSVIISRGEGQRKGKMEVLKEELYSVRGSKDYNQVYQNVLFFNSSTQEMKALDTSNSMVFTSIQPEKKLNAVFYHVIAVDHNKDGKLDNSGDITQLYASDKKGNRFAPMHPVDEAFNGIQVLKSPNIFRVNTTKDLNGDGKFEGWDEARYYQVRVGDTISSTRIGFSPEVMRILSK
ncbi:MAG: hypothetical protein K1X92_02090 [Bacteroidia bacterium]|nr:hypothetical protein [Bacteroidia bacterium]